MAKPIEIEILLKDRLSAGLDAMQRKLDNMMDGATSASQRVHLLNAAIGALNVQLTALKKAGKSASPDLDQRKNIESIEKVEAKIKELQTLLESLDATAEGTQTIPSGTTQAVKQYNGLNVSVQQIVRELPSATMGLNMFFLAISNNLPILTDEIKRAKAANEELKASGQKGVPVWKQLVSSLFSWQSVLMVGITLLTMYGKDIANWVSGLFKAEKQIDAVAEAANKWAKAMGDAQKEAVKEQTALRILYNATQDHTKSLHERNIAADELQKRYPKYFENLSNEAILAGDAAGAYRQLTADILKAAKARSIEKEIQKIADERLQLERGITADTNWTRRNAKEANYGKATTYTTYDPTGRSQTESYTTQLGKEYNRRIEAINQANKRLEELNKIEQGLIKRLDVSDLITNPIESTSTTTGVESGNATEDAEREQKEIEDARLKAEEDLNKMLLDLRKRNQSDEIAQEHDGRKKRLAEIEADYEARKAEIASQSKELAELNRKAGITEVNADGLTKEQAYEIARAEQYNEKGKELSDNELLAEDRRAMNVYLKEYGTYQQKKLAIAREYAEKIRMAQNDGERMSLERQRDSESAALDLSYLKQSIDWTTVFGEFGGMFSDIIRPALEKAKAYMQTDEFKRLDPSSQNDIVDAVRQMEQSTGGSDKTSFKRLGTEIDSLRQSMLRLNDAKKAEAAAIELLRKAEEDYEEALRGGISAEIEAAQTVRDTAQKNADSASETVRAQEAVVNGNQRNVTNTASTLRASMENVTQGLQRLSSAGIKNAYDGLIQLGKGVGGVFGDMANSLEKIPVVGWIVSIIDVFKDGLSNFIGPLVDSIFNAVSGIIGDVLSGDVFKTVSESLVKGIGGVLDAITFGGFSSWFNSGDSDPHLEEDIERLSSSNEALADAIEALTEELKESSGVKAVELYEKQMEELAASEANVNEMMRRSGSASSNGFLGIGGSHSSDYEINKTMSAEEWRRISEAAGRAVRSAGDFWTLTSEEMLAVAREAPDLYAKIKTYADDGYKDAAQYMDDYIAFAEQREELEQAYYESLTQVSFDSVYDSFLDMLMDMDASWEDMSDDMSEYLMRALLRTELDEQLRPEVEEWYKSFGEAMADGILAENERNALADWWNDIVDKGLSLRDSAAAATGYTGDGEGTTQSGKPGSFNAMSQEQGTKLEGLFTSGQMHWASIDGQMQDVSEQMGTSVDHLRRIEENTGNSARHLDEIKSDIKKIIRDGLKMK